ncbi:WD40 repeat domain-containing protein [bacterium]|nr:WD40 repeat domain-containing protein [bacterium]
MKQDVNKDSINDFVRLDNHTRAGQLRTSAGKPLSLSGTCWLAFLILVVSLLAQSHVWAVSPGFWNSGNQLALRNGTIKGVALNNEGHMTLSHETEVMCTFDYPVLSILPLANRSVLVGTGNSSTIQTCSSDQGPVQLLKLEGLAVSSMSQGPDGRLYFINQHTHSIDILDDERGSTVFCTIPETYIWDMVWDKQGILYVATGNVGRIYQIKPLGKPELYFDAGEEHIMVLTLTPDNKLLAGSEGKGILYQIEAKNKARVLYDSPLTEISAVVVTKRGDIFFSAIPSTLQAPAQQTQPTLQQTSIQPTNTDSSNPLPGEDTDETITVYAQPQLAQAQPQKQESSLYYLPSGGTVRKIWGGDGKLIFDLVLDQKEQLYIGLGKEACLYSLDDQMQPVLQQKFEAEHITCLKAGAHGQILIGTSGPGMLISMSDRLCTQGHYISETISIEAPAEWGRAAIKAALPSQTGVQIFCRTGNSAEPDQTWSTWSEDLLDTQSIITGHDQTQYAQVKVKLTSAVQGLTPQVYGLSLSYQERNVPPDITSFLVVEPVQPWFKTKNAAPVPNQANSLFARPLRPDQSQAGPKNGNREFLATRNFIWIASDANKDKLVFDLELKPENSDQWLPIVTDFSQNSYKLDTELLPDGIYSVRLTASDRWSNEEQTALSSTAVISYLVVDNTPPTIDLNQTRVTKDRCLLLEGTSTDTQSRIFWAEYSLDAQNWVFFQPEDRIYDQNRESFSLTLCGLTPGEKIVIIQVIDEFGNSTRALRIVQVP